MNINSLSTLTQHIDPLLSKSAIYQFVWVDLKTTNWLYMCYCGIFYNYKSCNSLSIIGHVLLCLKCRHNIDIGIFKLVDHAITWHSISIIGGCNMSVLFVTIPAMASFWLSLIFTCLVEFVYGFSRSFYVIIERSVMARLMFIVKQWNAQLSNDQSRTDLTFYFWCFKVKLFSEWSRDGVVMSGDSRDWWEAPVFRICVMTMRF